MLCPEKHQFYFLKNLTYLFLKTVSEKAYIIHLQHEIAARAGWEACRRTGRRQQQLEPHVTQGVLSVREKQVSRCSPGVWHGGGSGRENPGAGPARGREQVHLGPHCIRSAREAAGFLKWSWCRKGREMQLERMKLWTQWGKDRVGWTDHSMDIYRSFLPRQLSG